MEWFIEARSLRPSGVETHPPMDSSTPPLASLPKTRPLLAFAGGIYAAPTSRLQVIVGAGYTGRLKTLLEQFLFS